MAEEDLILIDGSQGEGGGQVIRTSLALSMITGTPFEIQNVRGRRKNAGLARQHLTCVRAAQTVCDATVQGAQLKSSHLRFEPGTIQAGRFHFPIGTAGSTSLVAQTVLPALLTADDASEVIIQGGTHNQMAPPFDALKDSFLELVNRMGPQVDAQLDQYGFYPAGGGKITINISPGSQWRGLELLQRGTVRPFVTAVVSKLPAHIAQRECSTICRNANWSQKQSRIIEVENPRGPGNVVMIHLNSEHVTEVFSGVGEIGVRAEQVARRVLRSTRAYLDSDVPVGPHLADQLMLPMSIAAIHGKQSMYRTLPLTQHSITHREIIQRFLDVHIETVDIEPNVVEVRIGPA